MTVTRDLTEIGAIVFLLTSLFLLWSGKDRWATLLLTLALLTRESTCCSRWLVQCSI